MRHYPFYSCCISPWSTNILTREKPRRSSVWRAVCKLAPLDSSYKILKFLLHTQNRNNAKAANVCVNTFHLSASIHADDLVEHRTAELPIGKTGRVKNTGWKGLRKSGDKRVERERMKAHS
ncbi:hypothetical protein POVCU2_0014720 [Plasmodium ovale curtisi]|uniref:Uncharacterized protein n=1 Tax=Plasmodium ovale curtisi TaxID=864141 RepID=A0A1A8VPH2_PLAOA|nr:hypothetical protein POVCU2_0014720 [Plasmodium ovale curtisi]